MNVGQHEAGGLSLRELDSLTVRGCDAGHRMAAGLDRVADVQGDHWLILDDQDSSRSSRDSCLPAARLRRTSVSSRPMITAISEVGKPLEGGEQENLTPRAAQTGDALRDDGAVLDRLPASSSAGCAALDKSDSARDIGRP